MNDKDPFVMRAYPDSQLPQTPAGRLEWIMEMSTPRPIYCDCNPGCRHVIGYSEPLISKKLARKLLDATPGVTASPPSAPRRRGR